MIYAFQDRDNLYLVMDLMTGGDLRYHLAKNRRFTEEQTSLDKNIASINSLLEFFSACIVAGLEFIHGNGVLHRDIKPENLVFESNGKLRKQNCYFIYLNQGI